MSKVLPERAAEFTDEQNAHLNAIDAATDALMALPMSAGPRYLVSLMHALVCTDVVGLKKGDEAAELFNETLDAIQDAIAHVRKSQEIAKAYAAAMAEAYEAKIKAEATNE
jgi:hypothetical protein